MTNIIATVILLAISLFVINLFPMGRDFIGNIIDTFHEKQANIMEEYERVKGTVDEVTTTVTETKEKVDNAIEDVNKAVDSASKAMDSVNKLVGKDEEESEADPNAADPTTEVPTEESEK